MAYYISTDATSDFPKSYYKQNFAVLPMSYTLDGIDYDGKNTLLSPVDFYEKIRNGAVSNTSLINEFSATEFFEPLLKQGNDILHICFSSALSGTYKCVCAAADELNKVYANKVVVIDSLCASMGEGLLVYYALKKREEGANIDENATYIEGLKHNISHYVAVEDLFHLYRGGRVSKTKAVLGTMLDLKPIIYVNSVGKLIPFEKIRTRKKSLLHLVSKMEEKMQSVDTQDVIFIGHSDCLEDAEFVAKKITEKFGIKNIVIDFIGTVIGSHTGCGTVALFFIGKDKFEAKDKD